VGVSGSLPCLVLAAAMGDFKRDRQCNLGATNRKITFECATMRPHGPAAKGISMDTRLHNPAIDRGYSNFPEGDLSFRINSGQSVPTFVAGLCECEL